MQEDDDAFNVRCANLTDEVREQMANSKDIKIDGFSVSARGKELLNEHRPDHRAWSPIRPRGPQRHGQDHHHEASGATQAPRSRLSSTFSSSSRRLSAMTARRWRASSPPTSSSCSSASASSSSSRRWRRSRPRRRRAARRGIRNARSRSPRPSPRANSRRGGLQRDAGRLGDGGKASRGG